jgi:hypothetical protein
VLVLLSRKFLQKVKAEEVTLDPASKANVMKLFEEIDFEEKVEEAK